MAAVRSEMYSTVYRPFGVPERRNEVASGEIASVADVEIVTLASALSFVPKAFETTTLMLPSEMTLAGRVRSGSVADARLVPFCLHWY